MTVFLVLQDGILVLVVYILQIITVYFIKRPLIISNQTWPFLGGGGRFTDNHHNNKGGEVENHEELEFNIQYFCIDYRLYSAQGPTHKDKKVYCVYFEDNT